MKLKFGVVICYKLLWSESGISYHNNYQYHNCDISFISVLGGPHVAELKNKCHVSFGTFRPT